MRVISTFTLLISLLPQTIWAAAETYEFDKNHTNIIWFCNHLGFSDSTGQFMDFDGHFTLNEENPAKSSVDVTIHINSLRTGIEKFDEHLKSADFFNVEKFPTAHFKSTNVEITSDQTAKVHGEFTMLGITKSATLDVTLNQIAPNPRSNVKTAGFSITTTIDRAEYGMEYGLPHVGQDVELIIEAEGTLKE